MTAPVVEICLVVLAVCSAGWSGLLALAQEAPGMARGRTDSGWSSSGIPLYRALQTSRLALLLVSAASTATAVSASRGWGPGGVWGLFLGLALALMLGDILPRGIAALAPHLAALATRRARSTLPAFVPLLSLVAAVERGLTIMLPPVLRRRIPGQNERDMLAGVISLSETQVADIMTPRLDIVAVNVESDWPAVVEVLRRGEHARLPVFTEDIDEVVGILYAKDFTAAIAGVVTPPANWRDAIRPAAYVPESKSLAAQLRDFQRGPSHLAVVVDEFGGTSGLITLEDVLEEVVGEIYGEYDRDEGPPVEREGSNRFWVDGTVTLDTLSEVLATSIEREDVSTVGGLIYSELGRVPRPGEELHIAGFRVVVERVVRRRIQRVYFEREDEDDAASAEREADR